MIDPRPALPARQSSRALFRQAPVARLGGMPVALLGLEETADLMVTAACAHRRPGLPLYHTSTNGEVLSRHARDSDFAALFDTADLVSADGQPMVLVSRLFGKAPLPERVATTDLYHSVARQAAALGLSFYLYGASDDENRRAVEATRRLYPDLRIVGHSHGYHEGAALDAKIAEIDALAPDILWVALGVPREQIFVRDFSPRLTNVALIKTSGGLFNFLSGSRSRAPAWLRNIGFEWIWRLGQEPLRLFWRYTLTNPHAFYLLMTRSGSPAPREAVGGGRPVAPALVRDLPRRAGRTSVRKTGPGAGTGTGLRAEPREREIEVLADGEIRFR